MSKFRSVSAALDAITAAGAVPGAPLTAAYRDKLNELYRESSAVSDGGGCTLPEFRTFLQQVHDVIVTCDSILRSIIIRVVRLLLLDSSYCACLVEEDFHWLLVVSLERDHEFVQERMQALKCMRKFIEVSAATFPIAFARSLVAVASNKDDNIRRVCLETVRELIIVNTNVVVQANGLTALLDAVIEPNTQDMAQSILLSVLYLLNDPKARSVVATVSSSK
jgi:rapamycin-insensitive companion of mTOR